MSEYRNKSCCGDMPYGKVVPTTEEPALQPLAAAGAVIIPCARRESFEAIGAGGDDTTPIIGELRR